jgi:hypothetical protein
MAPRKYGNGEAECEAAESLLMLRSANAGVAEAVGD